MRNPRSIAPGPLAVNAGYEWQKAVLRIFSFKGTRGFLLVQPADFLTYFRKFRSS